MDGLPLPPINGGHAGPSTADGMFGGGLFDASGWNVNFGAGGITSARSDAGDLGKYLPWVAVAVGAVLVWRMARKR
jgi:hypothetical protein